jgi:hypothetical protein
VNAALEAPAALVSAPPADPDAPGEYSDWQQRVRNAELLANRLGYPRMSEVSVYGGGALWGYALTGANAERLTQLEAALYSWQAGNRSWDVPAIICPTCQERGCLGMPSAPSASAWAGCRPRRSETRERCCYHRSR